MSRKIDIPKWTREFHTEVEAIMSLCQAAEQTRNFSESQVSMVYDASIIKLYASFERLMLRLLKGAINRDSTVLTAATGLTFPTHLSAEVCEYVITGGGYFDFKGRDGLLGRIKETVGDKHYLYVTVKKPSYRTSLERLCSLRNYAAHESVLSKRTALKSINQRRMGSAGSWLKRQGRLEAVAVDLTALAEEIRLEYSKQVK